MQRMTVLAAHASLIYSQIDVANAFCDPRFNDLAGLQECQFL